MEILLQLWGGLFYLLAKIILSLATEQQAHKKRASGWFVYLLGVPAWGILLSSRHNWIAVAVEAGGVPTMLLGIFSNLQKMEQIPKLVDGGIKVLVLVLIFLGVGYSVYDLGGINSLSQVLEFGVTGGYLIGTYLLTKKDRRGWLWFVLMNTSMAILTAIQGRWIFCLLQVASM